MLIPPPSPPPEISLSSHSSTASSNDSHTPTIAITAAAAAAAAAAATAKEKDKVQNTSISCCPFNITYLTSRPVTCNGDFHMDTDIDIARGRFSRVVRAIPVPPSPPQSPTDLRTAMTDGRRGGRRRSGRFDIDIDIDVDVDIHIQTDSGSSIAHPTSTLIPSPGSVLAVKKPATGSIIEKTSIQEEASILSYISSITNPEERNRYIVNFYGFVPSQCALVLGLVDLTLEEYILAQSSSSSSSSSKTDPIIGNKAWLKLALSLTSGLDWLHEKVAVVHGDIKPCNILLQPKGKTNTISSSPEEQDPFPYNAIYIDFGSAHNLSLSQNDVTSTATAATAAVAPNLPPSPTSPTTPTSTTSSTSTITTTTTTTTTTTAAATATFSVGTPAFTAPELLSLRSSPAEIRRPTKPADIFSLAATLLSAVTGHLQIYHVSNTVALYHMAQNGHLIIENLRNSYPMRLLPRSMAVRLLKGAIVKAPEMRWTAREWSELIKSELEEATVIC
ncbi:hypothetical protein KEM54_006233 [Ascosphaera aggregata]|nr:hypothetical protein KEM54_006233 [Ascosphaera aggregata]